MVCGILSVGWCIQKTLAINWKVAHVAAAGFLSHYLSGPLPYAGWHITVNKNVLSESLNKTFPYFNVCVTAAWRVHKELGGSESHLLFLRYVVRTLLKQ